MPRLPNAHQAVVAEAKIARYLLDHDHPDGAPKARFLERFGFSPSRPADLREALLAHVATYDVDVERSTEFGMMYEIVGPLPSPDNRNPTIRTVWIIDDGSEPPRFVTLVPDLGRTR